MIEQIVLEYLSELISVPVLMELPEVPSEDFPTMPERFIILEKVGGGVTDHIWRGSVAVQSYSLKSLYDASVLDAEMTNAMWGIVAREEISGVRMASSYNHTDTRTKRYRYQTVFDFNF